MSFRPCNPVVPRVVPRAVASTFAALAFFAASPAHAQEWPDDVAWIALRCGAVPSFDPVRDEPGAIDERDVVGNTASPALYIHADDDHVFFRMRVSSDPLMGDDTFLPSGWGVVLDTDGDPETYQLLLMLDGIREQVVLRRNTVQAVLDNPRDPAEVEVIAYDAATHARAVPTAGAFASTFDDTPDFFVDWAVDWEDLRPEGVDEDTSALLVMGTSTEGDRLNADLACHHGGTGGTPRITIVGTRPVHPDGTPAPRPDDPDDPDDPGPGGPGADGGPSLRGGGGVASGCSCETAGGEGGKPPALLLAMGLLGALALRRRRRGA